MTAAQLKRVMQVPTSTLRTWVERGLVRKIGRGRFVEEDVIKMVHQWRARKSGGKHV